MTTTDQRPDPNSVSHEAVAVIAQERAGQLFQDVILRDAKIGEQQQYIARLEARVGELEQHQPDGRQVAPINAAAPRAAHPRHTDLPAAEMAPQPG